MCRPFEKSKRLSYQNRHFGQIRNMKFCTFVLILTLAVSAIGQTRATINNGSGDGNLRGQTTYDIWADPAPAGTIFDRWTGDTNLIARPDEWHTKVKSGVKNVNLTATFKTFTPWTPSAAENIGTSQMRYYFPQNPVGLVIHFHGSGGNMNGLYTQFEQIVYVRDLVDAGFAVASLSSDDRVNAQWSVEPIATNPDVANVQAAINSFITRGFMSAQTRVFASGISNGGGFAPRISLALNFRGTAVFIATSSQALMNVTNVPTMWNIMENDTTLEPGSVARATENFQTLQNRGIRAELNIKKVSPVFPEVFRRVPPLTAADSLVIYTALKSNGLLDQRDFLIENPGSSNWQSAIPPQYNGLLNQIGSQLSICYAEHQFFSEYSRRTVSFFNSLL
jgi:hypothetical protein